MYGSSFRMQTEIPRALSNRPIEATVIPLPTDETTPPETKMYFVARVAPVWSTGFQPSTFVRVVLVHYQSDAGKGGAQSLPAATSLDVVEDGEPGRVHWPVRLPG